MSISALIKAREHLKNNTTLHPVPTPPTSVTEFHALLDAMGENPIPRAEESLAQAKQYFTREHKACEFRMAFGSLSYDQRALILIASNIEPTRCIEPLGGFSVEERTAIVDGLKLLHQVTNRFERAIGNIKHITPSIIH
ncbi:hypothetical protein P4S70_01810 [Enterovibrio sp. Hal110]